VGIGRGAFEEVFPQFQRLKLAVTYSHAENILLQMVTEWGYVISVALIALICSCVPQWMRAAKRDPTNAAILAALVGLTIQNLFDFNLEFGGTAIPSAILIGSLSAQTGPPALGRAASRRKTLSQVALVAGFGTVVAILALPMLHHDLRSDVGRLQRALSGEMKPAAAHEVAETAVARHPVDYQSHLLAGIAFLRYRNEHGIRHLNQAMILKPTDGTTHLVAARALASANHVSQAALEYRSALELGLLQTDELMREIQNRCGNHALDAIPDRPQMLITYAGHLSGHRQPVPETEAAYAKVLTLVSPPNPSALAALRNLLAIGASRPLKHAKDLAATSPYDEDLVLAAETFRRMGQIKQADETYIKGLNRFAGSWRVVSPAVDALLRRSDVVGAEKSLRTFLELPIDRMSHIAALDKLAMVQEQLGLLERARQNRQAAIRLRAISAVEP
jgi:tetratricopeptide (TPR) repeat protein